MITVAYYIDPEDARPIISRNHGRGIKGKVTKVEITEPEDALTFPNLISVEIHDPSLYTEHGEVTPHSIISRISVQDLERRAF